MHKYIDEAINTFLVLGFIISAACLFMSLAGCSHGLEIDVKLGVDLDDKCLLLFPECFGP